MRIVTTTEQLLHDLLQEQKRTNELLEKLIPATAPKTVETPAQTNEEKTELASAKLTPKRGK